MASLDGARLLAPARAVGFGRFRALGVAAVVGALVVVGSARAAFIIEIDTDGLDDGVLTYSPNFSFGGDTDTASQSVTSPAFGTTGGDSIFGGNGVTMPDTYIFTYTPELEADNLVIAPGTALNDDGDTATGVTGGGVGIYSVYATWPFSENVSGGSTTFTVVTAGDMFSVAIDQNATGGEWIKLGDITYASGPITVTQEAGANTFVSMRGSGVLMEQVPEPGSGLMLLLGGGAFALAGGRRRRAA